MPFYLGQRYVANADQQRAIEQAERIRNAVRCAPMTARIRLVSTTFVPNEEWVFDLFEADSPAAVEHAYAQGTVRYERVAEAIYLTETSSTGRKPC